MNNTNLDLLTFFITNALASKLSLFISILIMVVKTKKITFLPTKMGIISRFQASSKSERKKRVFLLYLIKKKYRINRKLSNNKIIKKVFLISHKITKRFFLQKHFWLFNVVTYFSGICIGLFFWLRMLIILGYYIPGQNIFLCFFAINVLFRMIISLGLVLRVGNGGSGEQFWRHLTEQINKNKNSMGKMGHFPFKSPNDDGDNNQNQNHYHYHFHAESKRDRNWTKAGIIGSVTGGGVGIVTLIIAGYQFGEYRQEKYQRVAAEHKIEKKDYEIQLANNVIDDQQKHIEKQGHQIQLTNKIISDQQAQINRLEKNMDSLAQELERLKKK